MYLTEGHEALERLRYIKLHPHKFERVSLPVAICYLKLTVELFVELETLAMCAV